MKTAVSVPDRVFAEAERLARRLKKSRSRLYAEALGEYVARHDPELITQRLDEVLGAAGTTTDEFVSAAARRTLERSDW